MRLISPVRAIAHGFGGSHAQRDVIDLTLIEAAIRAGDRALAQALSAERLNVRPDSPLSHMFARRAEEVAATKPGHFSSAEKIIPDRKLFRPFAARALVGKAANED